jgi:hypothetical protein
MKRTRHKHFLALCIGAALGHPAIDAQASTILELNRTPSLSSSCYGLLTCTDGQSGGSQMAQVLANGGNTITQTNSLAGDLTAYDTVWVSINMGGDLNASEISSLQAFIASGRKVVMIGNSTAISGFSSWDNALMQVVGGALTGVTSAATYPTVASNELLTTGVNSVRFGTSSRIDTGVGNPDVLFSQDIAAVYGGLALVVLDENWMTNSATTGLAQSDNLIFAQDIAEWLRDDPPARANTAPEPASLAIFGAALLGVAGIRRRKR